jgi:hypothetical protein
MSQPKKELVGIFTDGSANNQPSNINQSQPKKNFNFIKSKDGQSGSVKPNSQLESIFDTISPAQNSVTSPVQINSGLQTNTFNADLFLNSKPVTTDIPTIDLTKGIYKVLNLFRKF